MYIECCTRIVCGRYIWRRCDPKKWKKALRSGQTHQKHNSKKAFTHPCLTRRRGKNWCFYLWSLARRRKIIKNFSLSPCNSHLSYFFMPSSLRATLLHDGRSSHDVLGSLQHDDDSMGFCPKNTRNVMTGRGWLMNFNVCVCRWMGWYEVGIVTTLLHHVLWSKNLQRLNKNISLIPKVLLLKKKESSQAMYQHTKRQKS